MTSDQVEQFRQIDAHYRALKVDFDSAEAAGAAIPQIHEAMELLEAAVSKAKGAIGG